MTNKSAEPQWKLIAVTKALGDLQIKVEDNLTIGRGQDNDLVLASKRVSRHHVSFAILANRLFIKDLDSSNGTMLNDTPLEANKPKAVADKDVISIAGFEFSVSLDAGEGNDEVQAPAEPESQTDEAQQLAEVQQPDSETTAASDVSDFAKTALAGTTTAAAASVVSGEEASATKTEPKILEVDSADAMTKDATQENSEHAVKDSAEAEDLATKELTETDVDNDNVDKDSADNTEVEQSLEDEEQTTNDAQDKVEASEDESIEDTVTDDADEKTTDSHYEADEHYETNGAEQSVDESPVADIADDLQTDLKESASQTIPVDNDNATTDIKEAHNQADAVEEPINATVDEQDTQLPETEKAKHVDAPSSAPLDPNSTSNWTVWIIIAIVVAFIALMVL